MLNLKSILGKRANGSAHLKSSEIAAAIAQAEEEKAAAETELDQLDETESFLLIENEVEGLDKLQGKRSANERIIKRVDAVLPMLRERLEAVREHERQVAWNEHRPRLLEASAKFIEAVRAAHSALDKLVGARDAAAAAGFMFDVAQLPFAPTLVNLAETEQSQITAFARALDYYRQTPETARPAAPVTVGPKFEHRAPPPKAAASVAPNRPLPAPAVRKAEPPTPPRARPARLISDVPPADHRRCRVIRSGYPDADGQLLVTGDLVDVPESTAQTAVRNGAIEFAESGK